MWKSLELMLGLSQCYFREIFIGFHSLAALWSPNRSFTYPPPLPPVPFPAWAMRSRSLDARPGWVGPSMQRPRSPLLVAPLRHGRDSRVCLTATRPHPSSPSTGTLRLPRMRYAPTTLAPDLSSCVAAVDALGSVFPPIVCSS